MSDIDEEEFADHVAYLLEEEGFTVHREFYIDASDMYCDVYAGMSHLYLAIEVSDKLEYGDITQAMVYGEMLNARPMVVVPAGESKMVDVMSMSLATEVDIIQIGY